MITYYPCIEESIWQCFIHHCMNIIIKNQTWKNHNITKLCKQTWVT